MITKIFLGRLSRTFFAGLVACLFIGAATNAAHAACATNEIDVLGDGTQCETSKFEVTTTSDATSLLWFIYAKGTFYVDCGDDGTLSQNPTSASGSNISGKTITRTSINTYDDITYTCTWGSAGAHTIRFGGGATSYRRVYYDDSTSGTIKFYKTSGGTQDKVASISGSLGTMFPVIGGDRPIFSYTFSGTKITSIPAGLFSGIDTSNITNTSNMFDNTFDACTNLASIPDTLFSGIDTSSATNTSNMFNGTFCSTGITSIPSGLFSTIDTSNATDTSYMFRLTFGSTGITSIPSGLFSTIDTSNATNTSNMFWRTFFHTNITSIPATLFSAVNTSSATNTNRMFYETFWWCDSLTSIPSGLFSAIGTTNPTNATEMFYGTFRNCKNLTSIQGPLFGTINASNVTNMFHETFSGTKITSIPAGLFSGINTSNATSMSQMFDSTFSNCTSLTSIPGTLFSTIDTSSATNTSNMFNSTFYYCQSLASIPGNLFSGINTSNATSMSQMFSGTFSNCTSLTSIPDTLFSTIDTSNATDTSYMFSSTFSYCSSLTSIPGTLFSTIDTSNATNTSNMFASTFSYCQSLTSIPGNLFSGINTSSATNTNGMFYQTFYTCFSLTSMPAGLFSTIDTSNATNTSNMFYRMFYGCSQLAGYIPPTTFPSTIKKGSSSNSNMWNNVFYNTRLVTTCPAGTQQYITGFESDWSGKVSCEQCPTALPTGASWVSGTCNFACENGYHTESFDLESEIGTTFFSESAYIDNNGTVSSSNATTTYGLTENGTFGITYEDNKGTIKGRAQCSTQSGTGGYSTSATLPDSTGQYCWCTVDEYTPVGGSPMSLRGPWVYKSNSGYPGICATNCAGSCIDLGKQQSYNLEFRSAVLESRVVPDICTGNTITINWSNASAADIVANTAGTATYGGDIRTPRAATIVPGKVFLGWKFSAPGE